MVRHPHSATEKSATHVAAVVSTYSGARRGAVARHQDCLEAFKFHVLYPLSFLKLSGPPQLKHSRPRSAGVSNPPHHKLP
jgi:hypothetical protein